MIDNADDVLALCKNIDRKFFPHSTRAEDYWLEKSHSVAIVFSPYTDHNQMCYTQLFIFDDGNVGYIRSLRDGLCVYQMHEYVKTLRHMCHKYALPISPVSEDIAQKVDVLGVGESGMPIIKMVSDGDSDGGQNAPRIPGKGKLQ